MARAEAAWSSSAVVRTFRTVCMGPPFLMACHSDCAQTHAVTKYARTRRKKNSCNPVERRTGSFSRTGQCGQVTLELIFSTGVIAFSLVRKKDGNY